MDIRKLFAKETENDSLVKTTERLMDRSERIMKRTLMTAMDFESLKDMSSEDFEMMRETSALWSDSKEYVGKVAEKLDQVEDLRKEIEDLNKKLDFYNELLKDVRDTMREIADKKDA